MGERIKVRGQHSIDRVRAPHPTLSPLVPRGGRGIHRGPVTISGQPSDVLRDRSFVVEPPLSPPHRAAPPLPNDPLRRYRRGVNVYDHPTFEMACRQFDDVADYLEIPTDDRERLKLPK